MSSRVVMKKCVLGALLAGAFTVANAAVISYGVVFAEQATTWSDNGTLQKFNPALGTLTGVQLDLQGFRTTRATINYNDVAGFAKWDFLGATVQLTAPNAITVLDLSDPIGHVWPADQCGGGTCTIAFNESTDGLGINIIDSANWGLYTGTDSFNFEVIAQLVNQGFTSGGGFVNAFSGTDASANVFVRYSYDPVPEPASLALVGLGLLGLVSARRAKKA